MNAVLIIGELVLFLGIFTMIIVFFKLINRFLKSPALKLMTKHDIPFKHDAYCNAEIQRILIRIKLELHACKVILARLHNGGVFANGMDMKKFTVTHETAGGSVKPLMDNCVGVLNSRYGIAFEHLAIQRQYCISDVDDCIDQNFKADMKSYGFKSTYLFLIQQRNGAYEGFIGVNFPNTMVMTPEQRDVVLEQVPRITDLINMKDGGV